MEVILLSIVAFIMAIDQFSFTEILYRPIITCTLVGFIMGDPYTGLIIGGTYELILIGNMPIGGAQPPNAVIGGIMAAVFAIKSGLDVNAAVALAVPFSLFGQYAVTLTFTFFSGMMAKADEAAHNADPKGIARINYQAMFFLGALFVVITLLGYYGGSALGSQLSAISEKYSWVMGGLGIAGSMMKYIGFAYLMKIMIKNELWVFYGVGFVLCVILSQMAALSSSRLLLIFVLAVAVAVYDFQLKSRTQANNSMRNNEGESDGI